MFTKILKAFLKLRTKWLVALTVVTVVMIMSGTIAIAFVDASIIPVLILLIVISVIIVGYSFSAWLLISLGKEYKQTLERLKTEFSNEEFTQVIFNPANSNSRNIQRCLLIFEDFNVTHYAKIGDDGNIIIVARDANGKPGRPVTTDPAHFDRNYKILK